MLRLPLDLAFHAVDQVACAQFRQHAAVRQRAILVTHNGLLDHPLDWQDDDGKTIQFKALQARIRNVQPFRYALIGEAWVTKWNCGEVPLTPSKSGLLPVLWTAS